jgi:spermidine synthase
VLKYKDVRKVVLCDIDPEMTFIARNNPYIVKLNHNSLADARITVLNNNALVPADSTSIIIPNKNVFHNREQEKVATVEIINLDATSFIEQISGIYDIIILDFPDPNAQGLGKLYSQQFYQRLSTKLSADGLIVQQSTSPYHAREVFLCVGRTMESSGFSAIPYKDNVPSFGEWGWWIAGKKERYTHATLRQKLSNIENIPVTTEYLTPRVTESLLIFGKDQLTTAETAVNTLANNIIFQYYLESWK